MTDPAPNGPPLPHEGRPLREGGERRSASAASVPRRPHGSPRPFKGRRRLPAPRRPPAPSRQALLRFLLPDPGPTLSSGACKTYGRGGAQRRKQRPAGTWREPAGPGRTWRWPPRRLRRDPRRARAPGTGSRSRRRRRGPESHRKKGPQRTPPRAQAPGAAAAGSASPRPDPPAWAPAAPRKVWEVSRRKIKAAADLQI